jgi:hypothetical protein
MLEGLRFDSKEVFCKAGACAVEGCSASDSDNLELKSTQYPFSRGRSIHTDTDIDW